MKQTSDTVGKALIAANVITPEQLERGLAEQAQTGEFICSVLIRLGFADKDHAMRVLSEHLGITYVSLSQAVIAQDILNYVPARYASHYRIIPCAWNNNTLVVAIADPLNIRVIDDIALLLHVPVQPAICYEPDIVEAIRKYYGIGVETLEKMVDNDSRVETRSAPEPAVVSTQQDASVITFVDQIFAEAIHDRASDVHFEPYQKKIRIRFRIDGVLYEEHAPETVFRFYPEIVSRLKIMAGLNIAERRLPQDGRIKMRIRSQELDMRISIMPSSFGEAVHVRILSAYLFLELEKLGLMKDDLSLFEHTLIKQHGIIFITGPTGSGKTTTLYACLSRRNSAEHKIITVEDPVEYQLEGVIQMQVHPKIGFDFAAGLRHILRHDPDVIMVGEVRDFETAEIAIRAALTGHLVFSTLHTNDAAGSITRLLDMGLEPYLISSSLECLVAQRLVRLICLHCRRAATAHHLNMQKLSHNERAVLDSAVYEQVGCPQCRMTGYRGRTAIYEVLPMSESIRSLILERASSHQIKQEGIRLGMRTLRLDGLRKVNSGVTTLDEVFASTHAEAHDHIVE